MSKFISDDVQGVLSGRAEGIQAQQESLKATATKLGISVEQMEAMKSEVMDAQGWDENTNFYEVMAQFQKMTSNSSVLQDAHLNNTKEGLQEQIDTLQIDLSDNKVSPAQHKLNLEKMKTLLQRQASLLERG